MAVTLRLSDEEHNALQARADVEGVPVQALARRVIREYLGMETHRERVFAAAERIAQAHEEALRELGGEERPSP